MAMTVFESGRFGSMGATAHQHHLQKPRDAAAASSNVAQLCGAVTRAALPESPLR